MVGVAEIRVDLVVVTEAMMAQVGVLPPLRVLGFLLSKRSLVDPRRHPTMATMILVNVKTMMRRVRKRWKRGERKGERERGRERERDREGERERERERKR
mgnify:CR=1 FL=1